MPGSLLFNITSSRSAPYKTNLGALIKSSLLKNVIVLAFSYAVTFRTKTDPTGFTSRVNDTLSSLVRRLSNLIDIKRILNYTIVLLVQCDFGAGRHSRGYCQENDNL